MAAPKQTQSIQVLEKASLILDILARKSDLTAAALSEGVGEPRSSVYRLLASLQSLRLIEAGQTRGTYRLGLRLLQLGSAVVARYDERQAALPTMDELHAATGQTVFLCIQRENEAVCIERIDGKQVQSMELRLGGSLLLHRGAAPKTLLAYADESFWRQYASRRELTRLSDGAAITSSELFAELREIRSHGYAISNEDVTIGISAVGAPVFDYSGNIRASLSVSGTTPVILDATNSITHLVLAAANTISRALGFRHTSAATG